MVARNAIKAALRYLRRHLVGYNPASPQYEYHAEKVRCSGRQTDFTRCDRELGAGGLSGGPGAPGPWRQHISASIARRSGKSQPVQDGHRDLDHGNADRDTSGSSEPREVTRSMRAAPESPPGASANARGCSVPRPGTLLNECAPEHSPLSSPVTSNTRADPAPPLAAAARIANFWRV